MPYNLQQDWWDIKNYSVKEIRERKIMDKKLNEYLSGFYYTRQILLVLSRTTDAASVSFATAFGAPVGTASVCTTLVLYVVNEIVKKMKSSRKKKKKA